MTTATKAWYLLRRECDFNGNLIHAGEWVRLTSAAASKLWRIGKIERRATDEEEAAR